MLNTMNSEINNETKIGMKYSIMSRIETVRGIRNFVGSPLFNLVFLTFLLASSTLICSIESIFKNTMTYMHWGDRFSYTFSSFINSRFIVQILAVFIIISLIMILINSMRKLGKIAFSRPSWSR